MKKTKNNVTGIVHALSGRKVGPIQMVQTLCEYTSELGWLKADGEDITCTKCKSMLIGKYPKHCCEKMDYYLDMKCDQHKDPFDCSDNVVYYKNNQYGLIIHDGTHSFYQIFYCPWCGKKL